MCLESEMPGEGFGYTVIMYCLHPHLRAAVRAGCVRRLELCQHTDHLCHGCRRGFLLWLFLPSVSLPLAALSDKADHLYLFLHKLMGFYVD